MPLSGTSRIRRRAFTLVELLVSSTVMVVLMGGIVSSIILAGHVIDDGNDPLSQVRLTCRVADRIAAELMYALSVTTNGTTGVTFTVADRDQDGSDETIQYAWSGTPGDPLTRTYNGGTAVNVAEDVREFALSYDLQTVTQQGSPTENTSAETILFQFDASDDLDDYRIQSNKWLGEYFLPTLPGNAVSWAITRVKFMAREDSPDNGQTAVQIRTADGSGLPTSDVLEQLVLDEADLTNAYAWQTFSFASVSGLPPDEGICLVLEHLSGAKSCQIRYREENAGTSNAKLVVTSNGGDSWFSSSDRAMLLYVYGTITMTGSPEIITTNQATRISVALRLGDESASRVETAVATPNMPEITVDAMAQRL